MENAKKEEEKAQTRELFLYFVCLTTHINERKKEREEQNRDEGGERAHDDTQPLHDTHRVGWIGRVGAVRRLPRVGQAVAVAVRLRGRGAAPLGAEARRVRARAAVAPQTVCAKEARIV